MILQPRQAKRISRGKVVFVPVRRHPMDAADVKRLISLTEAAKLIRGKGGKRPHVASMRRWANPKRGYRARGSLAAPIVLRTVRIGPDVCTLPEWVEEFERARLQAGSVQCAYYPALPGRRSAADEYLDRMGVGTPKTPRGRAG